MVVADVSLYLETLGQLGAKLGGQRGFYQGVLLFSGVLNTLITIFIGYLIVYHIWLWKVGKSTYQHIVEQRQANAERQHLKNQKLKKESQEAFPHTSSFNLHKKRVEQQKNDQSGRFERLDANDSSEKEKSKDALI